MIDYLEEWPRSFGDEGQRHLAQHDNNCHGLHIWCAMCFVPALTWHWIGKLCSPRKASVCSFRRQKTPITRWEKFPVATTLLVSHCGVYSSLIILFNMRVHKSNSVTLDNVAGVMVVDFGNGEFRTTSFISRLRGNVWRNFLGKVNRGFCVKGRLTASYCWFAVRQCHVNDHLRQKQSTKRTHNHIHMAHFLSSCHCFLSEKRRAT